MNEAHFDADLDRKLQRAERRAEDLLRWAKLRKRISNALRREIGMAKSVDHLVPRVFH